MEIRENYSLKEFNTFKVDVKTKYYIEINNVNDIYRLIDKIELNDNKYFILGGGSNILFTRDYDGIIISVNIKGMYIKDNQNDSLILDIGAGENWHNFVKTCVKSKYYGLENLALIPGKVGAAPVQNIGAYGVEQKDYFYSLSGVDLETRELKYLDKKDCDFSYRSSIFKKQLKDRFIITSVQYKLSRLEKYNLTYNELKNELNKFSFVKKDLQYIYDTIVKMRVRKLPDLNKIGCAGSFFKNPVIDITKYYELLDKYGELPAYQISETGYKLSAGWLIEKCNWKGYREGGAGVYDKHALVLVNYGNATGKEIYDLSLKICESVKLKFGIELEPEVIIL